MRPDGDELVREVVSEDLSPLFFRESVACGYRDGIQENAALRLRFRGGNQLQSLSLPSTDELMGLVLLRQF